MKYKTSLTEPHQFDPDNVRSGSSTQVEAEAVGAEAISCKGFGSDKTMRLQQNDVT
jgi:hypothetical protein